jgi:hypothetical protein
MKVKITYTTDLEKTLGEVESLFLTKHTDFLEELENETILPLENNEEKIGIKLEQLKLLQKKCSNFDFFLGELIQIIESFRFVEKQKEDLLQKAYEEEKNKEE